MKKIALFLCLMLICSSASAAVSVRMDTGALLLDESGEVIVPLDIYDDIVPLGGDLFAAAMEGDYALMDARGNLKTGFIYSDFRLADEYLLARRNGFWGMLGQDGSEISAFAYSQLVPDGLGGCWALKGNINDLESDELFLLDANGRETDAGITVRRMAEDAGDALIAVQLPDGGLWGYAGRDGKMIIPGAFSFAGAFAGGRAAVVKDGAYGVIGSTGEIIIDTEYDYLEISGAGFVLATKTRRGAWVFDLNGKEIARYEGEEIFAALTGESYTIIDEEKLSLYNAAGEMIEELGPDAIVMEGVGGQMIISDGAWGEACVRLSGTDALWQNLNPLGRAGDEALYSCMQGYAARYMSDLLGEIQYAMDPESMRYGVVNGAGEVLIPCEYEYIEYLADDRLLLHVDSLWQMCDSRGTVFWSHGFRQTEESSF